MFVKVGQKRNLCPYEIKFSRIKVKNLLDLYEGRKGTSWPNYRLYQNKKLFQGVFEEYWLFY